MRQKLPDPLSRLLVGGVWARDYEYTSQALAGGEAARNAHLLYQGFDYRARQAGHFTHVELAVFSRLYEVQIHRYSTYMHVFGSKSR